MPVHLIVGPGQESDYKKAPDLLEAASVLAGSGQIQAVVADKGYDSDILVEAIEAIGAKAVIPPRSYRKKKRDYERILYRERNRIERLNCRLKDFRRIATRYDKTASAFLAFAFLAASFIWLHAIVHTP
jgi:transposase